MNVAELKWFTRYQLPQKIIFDCGTEFMAEFAKTCREECGLNILTTPARNSQPNAIKERIHQTIINIIRTFCIKKSEKDDPWSDIISTTMFGVRAKYRIALGATPMQILFEHGAILNVKHITNWEYIQ